MSPLPEATLGKMRIQSAHVSVRYDTDVGVCVRCMLHVQHVDSRATYLADVGCCEDVDADVWHSMEPAAQRELIRRVVMRTLEHEVDEWLRVDGARVRDPHPELATNAAIDALGPWDKEVRREVG